MIRVPSKGEVEEGRVAASASPEESESRRQRFAGEEVRGVDGFKKVLHNLISLLQTKRFAEKRKGRSGSFVANR